MDLTFNTENREARLPAQDSVNTRVNLKRAIWVYFFLLIFEGALRKWILPALSTPLLIARDPVALWILLVAARRRLFPVTVFVYGMILIGLIGFFAALFYGHGNFFVALFGLRILALHFPLIFVIGQVLEREDVLNIGRKMLLLAPFMTFLIALQFYSPQSAWVNRGVGGNLEGAGFSGALGYFRPPGTFSFTNGTSLFYGLLAPYVFYFWLHIQKIRRLILYVATISLLAAIPLSISRGLLFSVLVSFIFVAIAAIRKPKYLGSVIVICFGALIMLFILNTTGFFKTSTEAFLSRFEIANKAEGGVQGVIGDRYLGGMIGAVTNTSTKLPFFGFGLGMGTNVGSALLTGTTVFLISEGEWGRMIGELGILLGFLGIFIRLSLTVKMAIYSYRKTLKGDILPWVLLSFGVLQIPQGQWAQPTNLGFGVLAGGLIMASLQTTPGSKEQETDLE